jgi:hypothetical protein
MADGKARSHLPFDRRALLGRNTSDLVLDDSCLKEKIPCASVCEQVMWPFAKDKQGVPSSCAWHESRTTNGIGSDIDCLAYLHRYRAFV